MNVIKNDINKNRLGEGGWSKHFTGRRGQLPLLSYAPSDLWMLGSTWRPQIAMENATSAGCSRCQSFPKVSSPDPYPTVFIFPFQPLLSKFDPEFLILQGIPAGHSKHSRRLEKILHESGIQPGSFHIARCPVQPQKSEALSWDSTNTAGIFSRKKKINLKKFKTVPWCQRVSCEVCEAVSCFSKTE